MIKSLKYEIMAIGSAVMWGLAFPVTKFVGGAVDSVTFLVLKFLLASLFLLVTSVKKLKSINQLKMVLSSILLGVLMAGHGFFQVEGLRYTSAANSGFITSMNVIFVPFFMYLFFRKKPAKNIIIGLIAMLIGFLFISGIVSVQPLSFHLTNLNYGDFLTLICALLTALYMVYFNVLSVKYDEELVNCIHFISAFLTMLVIWFFCPKTMELGSVPVMLSVLYCGIFAGGVSSLLLAKAQAKVEASKVAILCGLEPVFATLFATVIPDMNGNTEKITLSVLIGGSLLLYGAIKSSLVKNK